MGAIDNDQDKLTKATRSILQFVRWIIYKKRGRRFLLEKIFKKALASGKEVGLYKIQEDTFSRLRILTLLHITRKKTE